MVLQVLPQRLWKEEKIFISKRVDLQDRFHEVANVNAIPVILAAATGTTVECQMTKI
jgi:hypothetical protein